MRRDRRFERPCTAIVQEACAAIQAASPERSRAHLARLGIAFGDTVAELAHVVQQEVGVWSVALFGERRDGAGPRAGGGFGPPGNRGGGRGGGFGGGGNGAQLELSLYHSWYLRDEVRFNAETPTIDLLNGGTIGSAGQARHKIQLNAGVLDNGIGVRLSGSWTSPTDVTDRGDGSGPLYFSSLTTFDLRMFANLQQRFVGKDWARGTRVTLALSNLFNAHQNVRDGSGSTPQIYQPAFLDPYGRVASVSFRRLF